MDSQHTHIANKSHKIHLNGLVKMESNAEALATSDRGKVVEKCIPPFPKPIKP